MATALKLPVIVCDEQYDAEEVETAEEQVAFINATPQDVAMTGAAGDFAVFDPPLQGGALIAAGSGRWRLESVDTAFFTRKVT